MASIFGEVGVTRRISPDCLDHVLSYLTLKDCLSLGETSIVSLQDIQSDLERRRQRMKQSFAFSALPFQRKLMEVNGPSELEGDWVLLPTVEERISSLSNALPSSHSLSKTVKELLSAMQSTPLAVDNETDLEFGKLLMTHRERLRAHKLHAHILSQAIFAKPIHFDRMQRNTTSARSQQQWGRITVTLEQYIGDVLCATFLMAHAAAGIVEGGPTEDDWLFALQRDMFASKHDKTGVSISTSWYRAWIMMHSSVLRMIPFSEEDLAAIGITTAKKPSMDEKWSFMCYRPFLPLRLAEEMSIFSEAPALRVTFNEFGRLGPTFRGRDLIQSRVVRPPWNCLALCESISGEFELDFFRLIRKVWSRSLGLLELHAEAQRNQPMTVLPPLVSIQVGAQ